jgi:beta-mannosidase
MLANVNKLILLNDNWEFSLNKKCRPPVSNLKPGTWYKASVPGTIHTDLINNKLIPDPFYSDNENRLQWIGEMDWDYRTSFDVHKSVDLSKLVYIQFDGVDTIAEIILNGEVIGSTSNMFCSYEFAVSSLLKKSNNKLLVRFTSPYQYARLTESKYGRLPVALNSERVYIRKAQYSFGWDWGPAFATSGLWRNVSLYQKSEAYIEHYTFNTISLSAKSASLELHAEISNPLNKNLNLKIILSSAASKYETEIEITDNSLTHNFILDNPNLWFPVGYGLPALYNLSLLLFDGKTLLDEKHSKVGIRTIELQLKSGDKNTFRFNVNGMNIFARGADWIPSDLFIPRTSDGKYRHLLESAKSANMNMLRIWGGGFYENDIFYDLCDELGLLVWQDFMFACAAYPGYPEFIENISNEFRQNIKRLQNHPSLALWCGNNENEMNWLNETGRPYKELPGHVIYHQIIPGILDNLDPQRPYWPSSPFGFEDNPNSPLSGNRHQWEIWSMWKDYNSVSQDNSLFVSEFGFQGPADKSTLEESIPPSERNVQSEIFEFHNKQVDGNERIFRFLAEHLPVKTGWDDFLFLARLNQAFALKTCLQHWRSNYPVTNGSLIWQLNDCWPVTSWAIIDSNLLPKPAYYHVKNIFTQQIITFNKSNTSIEVILINSSHETFCGIVKTQIVNLAKGKVEFVDNKNVKLKGDKRLSMSSVSGFASIADGKSVIIVSVYDHEDKMIHRNYYAGKEWKHISLPNPEISLKKLNDNSLQVETDKPAFFITLSSDGIVFDNNSFILLPGEKEIIGVQFLKDVKLKMKNITVRTLNNYLD